MSFWYNLFTFTMSAVNTAHPAVINLSKYSTPFTPFYYILCHRRWSSCFWIESKELVGRTPDCLRKQNGLEML